MLPSNAKNSSHSVEQHLQVCILGKTSPPAQDFPSDRLLEFTQHQRDVFCVFSGNMVSQFRDFLNTEPQFAELRDRFPGELRIQPSLPVFHNHGLIRPPGEMVDDEMADDNDFEVIDSNDMVVDTHHHGHFNANMHSNMALIGTIPPPPPPPAPTYGNQMDTRPEVYPMSPVAYSSFLSNQTATGNPPLSAHGNSLASLAALRPSRPNDNAGGASRASLHQQPPTGPSPDNGSGSFEQPL